MSVTIDSLDIQIKSSAKSATAEIERLAAAINKLKGNSKVSEVTKELNKLTQSSKKAADAQEEHNESVDGAKNKIAGLLASLSSLQDGLSHAVQWVKNLTKEAIEWDGIQFRFGQAFGKDAEEVYNWTLKINEALGISVQEFMQYSGIYASLLKGFGVEQSKLTEISVGLSELTYDIWAFSNDRYKKLEDAAEAVRSAITGEIEPIRNAGIALTEASMQEYLDSVGQAHVSIEKLTEAQKAEVRYAVMVQSAMQQGIVGTYAREMDTAEGAVRRLSQQVKTLYQSIGSLFIPILQVAIPWISAFVDILTDAVYWVAELFGISIGKIDWSKTTSGVDGLADGAENANEALTGAKEAAKKLKSYTMGFDELNVISPPSDSGSGGASGADGNGFQGLNLKSVWDDALLESASKKVDEIKAKILEWKTPLLIALGLLGTAGILGTLGEIISKLVTATNLMRAFAGAISGNAAATSALAFLSAKWSNVAAFITGLGTTFSKLGAAFSKLGAFIAPVVKAVAAFVGGLSGGTIAAIVGIVLALGAAVVYAKNHWEEITTAVKGFFETNIAPKLEAIKQSWEGMKAAMASIIPDKWIQGFKIIGGLIGALVDEIAKWFKSVDWLKAIGGVFEWLGGLIFGVVSGVIAGAISTLGTMLEGLVKVFQGVVEIISGLIGLVVKLFVMDLDEARVSVIKIGEGIVNVFKGLWKATFGAIEAFVQGVVDWFIELWDVLVGHSIVPDMIEAIIEWFLSLPTKILDPIKRFCNDVKQTFINLWTNIKEWYTTSVAPKFTLKFWLEKFKNLKEGFTQTIKNAVNAGIDMMNKFIGWLNEKLHFSWDALTILGKEVFPAGSIQLFTIPTIPRLEKGGFLEDGLFTMNHGEIAGKFSNGQSVVANNQQIVEGIAAGVYEAVVAAMNATSGRQGQNVNVYLDGRQIAVAVEKRQSERGRTLMGNQLGFVY